MSYRSYPDLARDIFHPGELDKIPERLRDKLFLRRVEEMRRTVSTIITGRLFVSGEPSPDMAMEFIASHKITTVVTVDNRLPDPGVSSIYETSGIEHCILSLDDDEKVPFKHVRQVMEDSYKIIDKKLRTSGIVLVHCSLGRSRSIAVVVHFLLLRFAAKHPERIRRLVPQIIGKIRKIRPIARPNRGFEECLLRIGASLADGYSTGRLSLYTNAHYGD